MNKNDVKKLSYCLFWLLMCLFEMIYLDTFIVPNVNILPVGLIVLTTLARYLFYIGLFLGFRKLYDWLSDKK